MDLYRKDVLNFLKRIENAPFFIFDTETTGLSADDSDVIQFSAIKCAVVDGAFRILEEFDTYINPGYPIPDKITELTGISDITVSTAPTASDVALHIRNFLGNSPVLAGYNSTFFDQKFMEKLYRDYLDEEFAFSCHLDVLKMAKEKCPAPRKLINMAERAGVADKYSFHSSIDDAKATLDVLLYLLPMYDKPEPKGQDIAITRIQRWTRSHTLDRLYVSNTLGKTVYYDIFRKEWEIDKTYNAESVVKAVHAYCGVEDDAALVKKF